MKIVTSFQLLCIALLTASMLYSSLPSVAQSGLRYSAGLGGGMSYGGLGIQAGISPVRAFNVFAGLGYNLDALGYNLGVQYHFIPEKKIHPYLTGMYGYNTVLKVDGIGSETSNTYYGPSVGVGAQLTLKNQSYLAFEVLLPFRPSVYDTAVADLEMLGYEIKDPLPVQFGIGYHIYFSRL